MDPGPSVIVFMLVSNTSPLMLDCSMLISVTICVLRKARLLLCSRSIHAKESERLGARTLVSSIILVRGCGTGDVVSGEEISSYMAGSFLLRAFVVFGAVDFVSGIVEFTARVRISLEFSVLPWSVLAGADCNVSAVLVLVSPVVVVVVALAGGVSPEPAGAGASMDCTVKLLKSKLPHITSVSFNILSEL